MATHAQIVAELVRVLKTDGSPEARTGAAAGLGAAGSMQALTALRESMTHDGAASVRAAAAAAVGSILGRGNLLDLIDL